MIRGAARGAVREAADAAWIRFINEVLPAPKAFDKARGEKATLKIVTGTGFIVG